jgi:alginate O-acetyltransferase complex protein AlgI
MLFNSIHYALFLPLVFVLYWAVFYKNLKSQNALLLLASYVFYACWDWRFLFLLMFSTFLDYYTGLKMQNSPSQMAKKIWFYLSIGINLGFLGFFKYCHFFVDSFMRLMAEFGVQPNAFALKIILPVGISFYTFHGLSYVVDIYKNRINAERHFIDYALFVGFFPLLVAGPIERATHLLPQLKKPRRFNYQQSVDGLRQILWGLFKKIVIADQCADYVNLVFASYQDYSSLALLLGAMLFAFQIYGDFSGYSDIALGSAKLFGIDLLRNFNYPYFSKNMAEFWRRWHLSLSSWFKDYIYIPLGGSRGNIWLKIRNTFIIFLLSGFWHGANWTFVFWGFLNALFIMPSLLWPKKNTAIKAGFWSKLKALASMMLTFLLTCVAWVFFRSTTLGQALDYSLGIFDLHSGPIKLAIHPVLVLCLLLFFSAEWLGRKHLHPLQAVADNHHAWLRYFIYASLIMAIFYFGLEEQQFIYFDF